MASDKKQLARNLTAQLASFVTTVGVSLVLTPFLVENIGREAYGFVGLANNFVEYATIVSAAVNSMAGTFVTISLHRDGEEEASHYLSSVFVANIVLSAVLSIALALVVAFLPNLVNVSSEILGDVQLLWALIFANFVVGLLGSAAGVSTFVTNRLDLSGMRALVANVLRAVLLVVLFVAFPPAVWFMGVGGLARGIYTLVTNLRLKRRLIPSIPIDPRFAQWSKVKEVVSSGCWNSLTSLSSILFESLDLLLCDLFVSGDAMGAMSVAKALPGYVLSVVGSLSGSFAPEFTTSYAKGDYDGMRDQVLSACKLMGFFSIVPLVCIYALGQDFFALWVPDQDSGLLYLLAVLSCLEFPFALSTNPIWNVFTAMKRTRQVALFSIACAVLNVCVTLAGLMFLDDEIARMCVIVGVSSCIGVIRCLTFLPLYCARLLHQRPATFYPTILRVACAVALATAATWLMRGMFDLATWPGLILAGVVGAAISCVVGWFLVLSAAERAKLGRKLAAFAHGSRNR